MHTTYKNAYYHIYRPKGCKNEKNMEFLVRLRNPKRKRTIFVPKKKMIDWTGMTQTASQLVDNAVAAI